MQMIKRKKTKVVKIGNLNIGGSNPILIQSMAKVPTKNVKLAVKQIKELEKSGCEIIRVAVKDSTDACSLGEIKRHMCAPLVADIHFNYKFALEALKQGVDKIRLNPGNIYKKNQVKQVVVLAKEMGIPIRVGANSGSLRSNYLQDSSVSEALVKETYDYIKMLEDFGMDNLVISLKSSNLFETVEAYRLMSRLCNYPLHLGVTAAGLFGEGIVKSSIGIGLLLAEGIGDTIRVSLTDDPSKEVKAGQYILQALELRNFMPEIISCPTCGRCEVDLKSVVEKIENRLTTHYSLLSTVPPKVAVMGCVVNGPGEAKQADIGIAFGSATRGVLFEKGKVVYAGDVDKCKNMLVDRIKGVKG